LCLVFHQLVNGEQCAHPIGKLDPSDPREFGNRKLRGNCALASVPSAIADYCESALTVTLHEQPIFIRAAALDAMCN
jgi:hypothetical protein